MAKTARNKSKGNGRNKRKRKNDWDEYEPHKLKHSSEDEDPQTHPKKHAKVENMESQWRKQRANARAKQQKLMDYKRKRQSEIYEAYNQSLQSRHKKVDAGQRKRNKDTDDRQSRQKPSEEAINVLEDDVVWKPSRKEMQIAENPHAAFDEFVQTFKVEVDNDTEHDSVSSCSDGNRSESDSSHTETITETQQIPDAAVDDVDTEEVLDENLEEISDVLDDSLDDQAQDMYLQRYQESSFTVQEAHAYKHTKRRFHFSKSRSGKGLLVSYKPGLPMACLKQSDRPQNIPSSALEIDFAELVKKEMTTSQQGKSALLLNIRPRLLKSWEERSLAPATLFAEDSIEYDVFSDLLAYKDFLFAGQTFDNTATLRQMMAMHVMNHVMKSRDTISRNTERMKKQQERANPPDGSEVVYRDQGFCRATVLILLPFRSAAVAFVEQLISLVPATVHQVINKERFDEDYGHFIPNSSKEEDANVIGSDKEWKRVFAQGNTDDCFLIGISFTRKAMRLYSEYNRADIILASPLGLRQHIGDEMVDTAAAKEQYADRTEEEDQDREVPTLATDILSSIEICILDSASILLMQNIEHVRTLLQVLNVKPSEAPVADFARIRDWNLNYLGSFFRQTVLYAHGMDPILHSLFSDKCCVNLAGTVKVQRRYDIATDSIAQSETQSKSLLGICKSVPTLAAIANVVPRIYQIFRRIPMSMEDAHKEADIRFAYFEKYIFEPLIANPQRNFLIFIPSYFDYVRIRNLFSQDLNRKVITSAQCCEYTPPPQVSRARTSFYHGRVHVLLLTERFHFYHQYMIRGIRHIVWYGLPTIGNFYSEFLNTMVDHPSQQSLPDNDDVASMSSEVQDQVYDECEEACKLTSTAIFTTIDRLRLDRIVGNKRAERMCSIGDFNKDIDKEKKHTFIYT